jgi:hypothetical protein
MRGQTMAFNTLCRTTHGIRLLGKPFAGIFH